MFPLGGALLHVPATTLTGLNKVAFSLITDQSVICRSRSDILLSLQIMLKLKKNNSVCGFMVLLGMVRRGR